jgi:hypothetical protein
LRHIQKKSQNYYNRHIGRQNLPPHRRDDVQNIPGIQIQKRIIQMITLSKKLMVCVFVIFHGIFPDAALAESEEKKEKWLFAWITGYDMENNDENYHAENNKMIEFRIFYSEVFPSHLKSDSYVKSFREKREEIVPEKKHLYGDRFNTSFLYEYDTKEEAQAELDKLKNSIKERNRKLPPKHSVYWHEVKAIQGRPEFYIVLPDRAKENNKSPIAKPDAFVEDFLRWYLPEAFSNGVNILHNKRMDAYVEKASLATWRRNINDLDGVPFIGNDFDAAWARNFHITKVAGNDGNATVTVRYPGEGANLDVEISLLMTHEGWRIKNHELRTPEAGEINKEKIENQTTRNNYDGYVGKLAAKFTIDWHSHGIVSGEYWYPTRNASFKYRLAGTNSTEGVLRLNEYTNDDLTATIVLKKKLVDGRIEWTGTMHNTDGRKLDVLMKR